MREKPKDGSPPYGLLIDLDLSEVVSLFPLKSRCRSVLKSVLTQLWCTCGSCDTFALAP
jgi:hypothetical protein